MKFRFYFFKEHDRNYDRAELLTYLEAQPYMTLFQEGAIKRAVYDNTVLDMHAEFVFNTKSITPDIQRLNPAFLDLNIYVEFDVLNNTYKVSKIIDMVEVICHRFGFAVYNEYFEDVSAFKRSLLTKTFELVKDGYKKKFEEEFMNYAKLSKQTLDDIYTFLELKEHIHGLENYLIPKYVFLREPSTRSAYVAIDLPLDKPFIIPPCVQLIRMETEDGIRIVSASDLKKKISKYLTLVDARIDDLHMVPEKYFKKIKRIISKLRLDAVKVEIKEVPFNLVYDL